MSKIKKVAFIISSLSSGGAERVMSELANYSAENNLETYLILLSGTTCDYCINEKVIIISICEELKKYNKLNAVWKRFILLRKQFKRLKPDVILSFMHTCNMYTCLSGLFLKPPVVISERIDPKRGPKNKLKRFARLMIYPLAGGYIFQTNEAKEFFAKSIQKKACVIPNPVKDDLPYSNRTSVSNDIYVIGRLTSQKNYPLLFSAFAIIKDKYTEYKLHIFGEGPLLNDLKQIALEHALQQSIVFEGVVSNVHEKIKNGTMYVLSSDYEGMSNALLEAMAVGLPCISTDCPCGGSRHLISNGENGLLVPVGDVAALADAMENIILHKDFADKIAEKAVCVRIHHSREKIAKEYMSYLEKVLNRK